MTSNIIDKSLYYRVHNSKTHRDQLHIFKDDFLHFINTHQLKIHDFFDTAYAYMKFCINELHILKRKTKEVLIKTSEELFNTIKESQHVIDKNPRFIACAIVYIAAVSNKITISQREICFKMCTTETSIRRVVNFIRDSERLDIKRVTSSL